MTDVCRPLNASWCCSEEHSVRSSTDWHSCCCNSLLLDTEFSEGSRTAAKDGSSKEASDRFRSLDPKCTLAGPWMLFPLLCISVHAPND